MSHSSWQLNKTEALGEQGMVAANHPLAAEVGIDILKHGGNAVDAAVAMAFTLSVVEPYMNGIGGRGSLIAHLRKANKTIPLGILIDEHAGTLHGGTDIFYPGVAIGY